MTGTKSDLRKDKEFIQRQELTVVTPDEGQKVAKEVGAQYYSECSAKSQEGLKETFNYVIECVLDPRTQPDAVVKKSKCVIV